MDLFLETPQQQAERMLRQQQRLMEMQMQGAAAQPPAQKCHACGFACGRIGTRGLFRTARFICAGARVRQASCASSPRGPAPAHIGDDRAHPAGACGHLSGVVCPHVHPQRRIAQRGAPTSSGPGPAPRRRHNNHPHRLGELAFVTLGLLGCRDYRHERNSCILLVLSCD